MKTAQQILNDKTHNNILTIEPDRPVIDALIIMAEYKIGALLVMDKNKLLGIISERDYAREIVLHGRSSKVSLVKDIMTKDVITIDAHETYDKGLEIMTENRIRHLPVLENKKVIGMLSLGDLAKETISHQKFFNRAIRKFFKKLVTNNFNENSFFSSAIKFSVKNLLPRSKIQMTISHRDDHFSAHDLSLHMRIRIIFAGIVMTISTHRLVRG
jgi:CBS domain-containing protein